MEKIGLKLNIEDEHKKRIAEIGMKSLVENICSKPIHLKLSVTLEQVKKLDKGEEAIVILYSKKYRMQRVK